MDVDSNDGTATESLNGETKPDPAKLAQSAIIKQDVMLSATSTQSPLATVSSVFTMPTVSNVSVANNSGIGGLPDQLFTSVPSVGENTTTHTVTDIKPEINGTISALSNQPQQLFSQPQVAPQFFIAGQHLTQGQTTGSSLPVQQLLIPVSTGSINSHTSNGTTSNQQTTNQLLANQVSSLPQLLTNAQGQILAVGPQQVLTPVSVPHVNSTTSNLSGQQPVNNATTNGGCNHLNQQNQAHSTAAVAAAATASSSSSNCSSNGVGNSSTNGSNNSIIISSSSSSSSSSNGGSSGGSGGHSSNSSSVGGGGGGGGGSSGGGGGGGGGSGGGGGGSNNSNSSSNNNNSNNNNNNSSSITSNGISSSLVHSVAASNISSSSTLRGNSSSSSSSGNSNNNSSSNNSSSTGPLLGSTGTTTTGVSASNNTSSSSNNNNNNNSSSNNSSSIITNSSNNNSSSSSNNSNNNNSTHQAINSSSIHSNLVTAGAGSLVGHPQHHAIAKTTVSQQPQQQQTATRITVAAQSLTTHTTTSDGLPPNVSQLLPNTVSNSTESTTVDGINLDEIKEFAKQFKIRRLSLGLTQTQVGQALSATEGPAYSQSAICRFEKLDITPKSAQKIKPVLERWMAEAEERYKNGVQNLTEFIGSEPSKKRKRRTSFTPQALEILNQHFEKNTHPSGAEMTELSENLNYDREVIRVWFCNKRQALKNTIKKLKQENA
ncbi:POU domain, class 6, transcription factor 1-like isoform X1 [Octopus vulgaris]|uniref:POU domain protein n=1 Tax=Octopus vulgaris TaxID=6645 RepID=A0AA36FER5_OCTVU|nr:POU domain, class 6, transcription factor 1-like isoform X1 [Octopus vulgaris]